MGIYQPPRSPQPSATACGSKRQRHPGHDEPACPALRSPCDRRRRRREHDIHDCRRQYHFDPPTPDNYLSISPRPPATPSARRFVALTRRRLGASPATRTVVTATSRPAMTTDWNNLGRDLPAPQPAAIGDCVWHDRNANGIQDTGETGVPGVTVTLRTAAGTVVSTTLTNARRLLPLHRSDARRLLRVLHAARRLRRQPAGSGHRRCRRLRRQPRPPAAPPSRHSRPARMI